MKHLRIPALLLAMALCLTACGSAPSGSSSSSGSDAGSYADLAENDASLPDGAVDDVVSYLTDGALTKDSVVATVGDTDITAGQALYWTAYQQYYVTYQYYYYNGMSISMSDELSSGLTVGDSLLQFGMETALVYALAAQKAHDLGVTLSEADASAIASLTDNNIVSYGENRWDAYVEAALISEEDFTEEQKADWIQVHGENFYRHFLMYYASTPSDYQNLISNYYYYAALQDALFGAGGDYAPSEETMNDYLQTYISDNGVSWARCILFSTQDCADDAAVAEVQAQAQAVYDQLAALPAEELSAAFTEQQSQYDKSGYTPGEIQYFTNSDSLVDGFYEGVTALEPGQLGMTEQTVYGYFILLREEDQTDDIYDTVQTDYIDSTYGALIDQWREEYGVSDSPILELDTDGFYTRLAELQAALIAVDTIDTAEETGGTVLETE